MVADAAERAPVSEIPTFREFAGKICRFHPVSAEWAIRARFLRGYVEGVLGHSNGKAPRDSGGRDMSRTAESAGSG
jgi:hypothetical protein